MGELIAMFGSLELRRNADGDEVLVDSVDGSVHALPTTVDEPADEAGESHSRSEEEQPVAL